MWRLRSLAAGRGSSKSDAGLTRHGGQSRRGRAGAVVKSSGEKGGGKAEEVRVVVHSGGRRSNAPNFPEYKAAVPKPQRESGAVFQSSRTQTLPSVASPQRSHLFGCVDPSSLRSPAGVKLHTCLHSTLPVPKRAHRRRKNGCQPPANDGPGIGDLQGCGCTLHPGRVGAAEPSPEGPVQGCDAGELQQPGLPGTLRTQTRYVFPARKKGSVDARGHPWRLLS
nr:zinc finger protein 454 isoform X4 [Pongo pygmaeus]